MPSPHHTPYPDIMSIDSNFMTENTFIPGDITPSSSSGEENICVDSLIDQHDDSDTHQAPQGLVRGIIKAIRPHQWVKNFLVIAAPLAAMGADKKHSLLQWQAWVPVGIAFICFCLASSGIYLINDVKDVQADRQHPKKKYRPIAAGVVSPRLAVGLSIGFLLGALALTLWVNPQLTCVMVAYIGIQLAYCFGWKNQPVIDIVIVSSGFLMRAIAGGVSMHIHLSRWFLLVMAFGSLFMVAGKRYAELQLAQQTGAQIRQSLKYYTTSYLRFVWTLAATSVVLCYGMWALDSPKNDNVFYALSIAPFTVAILRYAIDIDGGVAGSPEDIALHDKVLQILALLWIGTMSAAVCIS